MNKVYTNKSKMIDSERHGTSQFIICLHDEEQKVVDEFRYLDVKFSNTVSGKVEIENMVMLGRKVGGAVKALVIRKI